MGSVKAQLSPRQEYMTLAWQWFRSTNYIARRYDWDGRMIRDAEKGGKLSDAEFIADALLGNGGGGDVPNPKIPLRDRRPKSPARLIPAIVGRFSTLLFTPKMSPAVKHRFDAELSAFVEQLVKDVNLWAHLLEVRNIGGAMGSGVTAWSIDDGDIKLEALDPRWVSVKWASRAHGRIKSADIRFQYTQVELVQLPTSNTFVEKPQVYWYRRRIDDTRDTVYKPMKQEDVDAGAQWRIDTDKSYAHGFGICPVVWVQNTRNTALTDGDPDCHQLFGVAETVDALRSQAAKGSLANCDPSLVVFTDDEIKEVLGGSTHAFRLPLGSDTKLLEIEGTGPITAYTIADKLKAGLLEAVCCVLDEPTIGDRATTTEVMRAVSAMHARADTFRTQYGEHAIKVIVGLVKSITNVHAQPLDDGTVGVVRSGMPQAEFDTLVTALRDEARELHAVQLELTWPKYAAPVMDDVMKAATAAKLAVDARFLTPEHAVRWVSQFFDVMDPEALLAEVQKLSPPEPAVAPPGKPAGPQPGKEKSDGPEAA